VGHTPNYGIGDSKFRKIVKFSVEFLGLASGEGQLAGGRTLKSATSAAYYEAISIKERSNVALDSASG
jgi:hypothetical protein